MKILSIRFFLFIPLVISINTGIAQQISIPRVEQMPDLPQPYEMRDWKKVAWKYDSLVFDQNLEGEFLPLVFFRDMGINYPDTQGFGLHTAIGTNSPASGEAINVIPAVVGASLNGIDKSNQFDKNWALMCADFFNKRPEENIYLNQPATSSGNDWWYETMPNIFFLQLKSLYPEISRLDEQLETMANQWLLAVEKMNGSASPWNKPEMNYRAWNMANMEGLEQGVKEPEAAGSIAWILYQTYQITAKEKYRIGAELALDFLNELDKNPSYELQLPYGIYTAARINAEQNYPLYDIEKLLNWSFNRGDLRGWGTIVGNWGDNDVSGLIGEANDAGNDYAFMMNGYQHAAALVPMVRYDDRFAGAIAKWMLNLANASRLFYRPYLPSSHQDNFDWSSTYDPHAVIGYEALKEVKFDQSPYATGDAIDGGWAQTNLMLYGSSHVGYMAALIEKTEVEGILKIDLLKTDFYNQPAYPSFLIYNPHEVDHQISFEVGEGSFTVYDAVSNQIVAGDQKGSTFVTIPAKTTLMPVIFPSTFEIVSSGKISKVNDIIIDYNNGNQLTNYPPKIRALTAPDSVELHQHTTVFCTAIDHENESLNYEWSINNNPYEAEAALEFEADATGTYVIRCKVTDTYGQSDSAMLTIKVVEKIPYAPEIIGIWASPRKTEPSSVIQLTVSANDQNGDSLSYQWYSADGTPVGHLHSITYEVPESPGNYWLRCKVTDTDQLHRTDSLQIMVRTTQTYPSGKKLATYLLNGNADDRSPNNLHGEAGGISWSEDEAGTPAYAAFFNGNSAKISLPASSLFNFADYVSITLKFKIEGEAVAEQFVFSHGSWQNRYKISRSADRIRFTLNTSAGIADLDSETKPQPGQWYHLAVVYDGQDMEIWLNGQLDAFKSHTGTINQTTYLPVLGQQYNDSPGFNFHGHLDNVSIYDYPLNPEQIEESRYVSLPEMQTSSMAKIYPNPTNRNQVNIAFNEPIDQNFSVTLFNTLGQRITLKSYSQLSPYNIRIILPDHILPGKYLIVVTNSQKRYQASLICTP